MVGVIGDGCMKVWEETMNRFVYEIDNDLDHDVVESMANDDQVDRPLGVIAMRETEDDGVDDEFGIMQAHEECTSRDSNSSDSGECRRASP